MKIAPSLHRIGNDVVACYLVEDDRGVTVIDAGLAGHWKELVTELTAMGRTLADVRGLVLTHGDTDHIGFAERLRREGVPVHVHEADADRARGLDTPGNQSWGGFRLGPVLRFLTYAAGKGGLRTTYPEQVRVVHDGDVLDLPGDPRVIALPGHSPGSIAVHVPAVDAVMVGDALTTRHVLTGTTGPQPAPFTDAPAEALRSLDRLRATDAAWVLPGHGPAWSHGVERAVDAVRAAAADG